MIGALKQVARRIRRVESSLPPQIRHPVVDLRQGVARMARRLVSGQPERPEVTRYAVPGCETFFGYFDRTPESPDGARLLAHATPHAVRLKHDTRGAVAKIGVFDAEGWRAIGETDLWSWQLGARLAWAPGADDLIAFNKRRGGKVGTTLVDGQGREQAWLPGAVFDWDPKGRFGLGIDMARLGWARPGYGYLALDDPGRNVGAPDGAVWRTDLASGERRQIASMAEILAVAPRADFNGALHYVNIPLISPDGERYLILHLWMADPSTPETYQGRALVGSCEGGGLSVVEDACRASHYCWRGSQDVVIFGYGPEQDEYRHYNLETGERRAFWPGLPDHDGHQTFDAAGELMVTDSYPDVIFGEQKLYAFRADRGVTFARFCPGSRYEGGVRCDLHPRLSRDERSLLIDCAEGGSRTLCRVALPEI